MDWAVGISTLNTKYRSLKIHPEEMLKNSPKIACDTFPDD
jgi:hypothetical protein